MLIVRWMILDDFGTSVYMPHAQRVAQWQLLCCLPRLLEVWIEAQRPKAQFRRVFQQRFLVSVSWRQLSGFQTTATQAMSALCGMSSLRHMTYKYLQDPKKWLLSIPHTHPWTLVQWRNTLSLNEVLHAPSRRLTQLQEHNDEVLPLWWEVVSVKMGSRGGFCRWQECYSTVLGLGVPYLKKPGGF